MAKEAMIPGAAPAPDAAGPAADVESKVAEQSETDVLKQQVADLKAAVAQLSASGAKTLPQHDELPTIEKATADAKKSARAVLSRDGYVMPPAMRGVTKVTAA